MKPPRPQRSARPLAASGVAPACRNAEPGAAIDAARRVRRATAPYIDGQGTCAAWSSVFGETKKPT